MDNAELIKETAYEKRNLPRYININGEDLTYKEPPLKNNIYKYRCKKKGCKFFVKINQENIDKLIIKENNIVYTEINTHSHINENNSILQTGEVLLDKHTLDLARILIIKNQKELRLSYI